MPVRPQSSNAMKNNDTSQLAALSSEEKAELARHENTLQQVQQAQLDAGRALRAIHKQRLYRESHATFEDYCLDRWGIKRQQAYRLIDAVEVIDSLHEAGVTPLPTCEGQTRHLKSLKLPDRIAVWETLVAKHGAEKVSRPVVEAAVSALKAEAAAARTEDGTKEPPEVSPALQNSLEKSGSDQDESPASMLVADIGILGDEPAEIEPTEQGSLVIAVPRTLYSSVETKASHVLTTVDDLQAHLGQSLDRELVRKMRDEFERLGYKPAFNRTTDAIDWAAWTFNPVTGCKKGCDFCYAREVTHTFTRHYPQGFRPTIYPGRLLAPQNMTLPPADDANPGARHVFIDSMGDLFGKWIPDAFIEEVLDVIRQHPEWTFKVLTKYPGRLPRFEYPENLWVGASVTCQSEVAHTEAAFEQVRASVRWVSCEPLQAPVTFSRPELFDLIVIGARTAANGLPAFQPEAAWVDALRMQARSVGAAVYEKENLHVRLKEFPKLKPGRLKAGTGSRGGKRPQPASDRSKASSPLEGLIPVIGR